MRIVNVSPMPGLMRLLPRQTLSATHHLALPKLSSNVDLSDVNLGRSTSTNNMHFNLG